MPRRHPPPTRRIYRLNPEAVAALRDQLDTYWQRALAGYAEVAGDVAQETQPDQTQPEETW